MVAAGAFIFARLWLPTASVKIFFACGGLRGVRSQCSGQRVGCQWRGACCGRPLSGTTAASTDRSARRAESSAVATHVSCAALSRARRMPESGVFALPLELRTLEPRAAAMAAGSCDSISLSLYMCVSSQRIRCWIRCAVAMLRVLIF